MPQRKKKDRDRANDDEWEVTFEDDFDEGRSEKWGVNTPWTFVPGDQDELQRYDESAIEVRDGVRAGRQPRQHRGDPAARRKMGFVRDEGDVHDLRRRLLRSVQRLSSATYARSCGPV